MELIKLILILVTAYALAVIVVKYIKNVSSVDARKMVNDFLKDLFLSENQPIQNNYNSAIGLDQDGYPLADVLDSYFQPLTKIFNDIYFCGGWYENNRFVYSFVVDEPIVDMSDEDLYRYCLKRCDTIVHRVLHQYNPYAVWGRNMVAITLSANQLNIFLANNIQGERENVMLKRRMRTLFKRSQVSEISPLEEEWGEEN